MIFEEESIMEYKAQYEYALNIVKNFQNYIEIGDFRRFLLLVLNLESGPDNFLSQLGMGGSKGKVTLPYDPEKKMYYAKAMSGITLSNQMTIYLTCEKKTDQLINKADAKIFKDTLSDYEIKNLLPNKFKLICPNVVDYSSEAFTGKNKPKPFIGAIESLFTDLLEFLIVQQMKYVFIWEGEGDQPDLLFTINMPFDPIHNAPAQFQYFDVYLDSTHQMRGNSFIWIHEDNKENIKIEVLKEIREKYSHSDMFNSNFTIIVPVKSFQIP
jgi:hypothetical protein